ncbi:phage/plasmid replication protein [Gallibacterium anatis]|uniref:phage/plasmid replication domain-containing protein n=1 Tax=Gallibacterium anatis TaxID=750 RepID=UPI001E2A4D09|nr:phage/plasmid replication protein [Gallibacterium anatis]
MQEGIRTPVYRHKGSYCDEVSIKISGSVIRMSGNPSRWGRVENLIGFRDIDACIHCFNSILYRLNLPQFTRCTEVYYRQDKDGSRVSRFSNGAIIRRLDITTNKCVGKGNERTFLRGLSTQRYRNSIARLHTNGLTVDWLSQKGNANLIYPSVYIKADEMMLHSNEKLKRRFGENSNEYQYFKRILSYCESNGVVRFEQKLKSRFLQREKMCFWGYDDFTPLNQLQEDFLTMDKKLRVNKMTRQGIAEELFLGGFVKSMRSARVSADYAMRWAEGEDMTELPVRTFKRHRAILRKIGLDIANLCDMDKFQATKVISCEQIIVRPFKAPVDYVYPSNLRIVNY